MITRPMKFLSESITDEQLELIRYPMYGSAKLDGILALDTGVCVLSATLKKIGNKYIQKCLSEKEYEGLQGELIVGSPYAENEEDDVFNRTTGPVRRSDGEPNFTFYVFDDFGYLNLSYEDRWLKMTQNVGDFQLPHVVVLEQTPLYCPQDVITFSNKKEDEGYEGAIIRAPWAPYKQGRTTFREQYGFKRVNWIHEEAEIIGFVEANENQNEKLTNELGLSKRSNHKENLVPKGTLGAFILKNNKWKKEFNCGTIKGGTIEFRQWVWDHRKECLGKIWCYKYKAVGSIEAPRQPIGKGFRDKSDITNY
jgi:DNA ligase-1